MLCYLPVAVALAVALGSVLLVSRSAYGRVISAVCCGLRPFGRRPCSSDGGPNLSQVFPPSRRALAEVAPQIRPAESGPSTGSVDVVELGLDYRLAGAARLLPSGFSVGEVRALGNFPDYAKLSGVPLPKPIEGFEIDSAKARPYRPFRWPYHQTMCGKALQKLDSDYWLELESTYRERISQRQALFARHGRMVLDAMPGSELARKELMEIVVQFLCARYPGHFQLVGMTLFNHILGTEHDLEATEPLRVLLDTVPEDFALVLRHHETGRYYFRAGIICSAIGWSLGDKMGLSLRAIHQPVPGYEEKIALSVDRFFSRLAAPSPFQRASWGLEIGQPLYMPSTDGEFKQREYQNSALQAHEVFLRVDWQTIRRLPLSGAVLFNFKALFTPMTAFRREPYVPSLVLKILNEGNEDILRYKGSWHVEHVAKPALEEYERYQIEQGMIERNWTPKTLDESPFFPGWREQSGRQDTAASRCGDAAWDRNRDTMQGARDRRGLPTWLS